MEKRRMGHPKTNAERKVTHERKFGKGSKLPKRGTGLKKLDIN
jgi:hypothetical protein